MTPSPSPLLIIHSIHHAVPKKYQCSSPCCPTALLTPTRDDLPIGCEYLCCGSQGPLDCTVQNEVLLCGSIALWFDLVDATKQISSNSKSSPRRSSLPSISSVPNVRDSASVGPCGSSLWCRL